MEELLLEYFEFSSRDVAGDGLNGAEKNRFKKVKELLGELFADGAMDHKVGSVQRARGVFIRGTKGPPIFDRVYDLGDDLSLLVGEEHVAIVDAKFGHWPRSRTNLNQSYLVTTKGGRVQKIPLPQKKQVRQLEAPWIRDRIKELARAEDKAAGAGTASYSLSARLKRAADSGKLQIYEIRTTIELGADAVPDIHIEMIDRTEAFEVPYRTGRSDPADAGRIAARKEAIENFYLEKSELKAKIDADAYTAAKKRLKAATTEVAQTQRAVAKVKKPATQREKNRPARQALANAKQLEVEAQSARTTAKKSEAVRKFNEERRDIQTNVRKAEGLEKWKEDWKKQRAETDAAKAERAVQSTTTDPPLAEQRETPRSVGDSAVPSREVNNKMIDARLQADRAARSAAAKGATDVASQAPRLAERAGFRSAVGLAVKGGRVVKNVGKFAFRLLNIANPVLDLLMVVDGIDLLMKWLKRDQIADAKQWAAVIQYLSGDGQVTLPPYGVPYLSGLGAGIRGYAGRILEGFPGQSGDFMAWYKKWNVEPGWSGFVYATVWIYLEQQEARTDDYPYEFTYWIGESPHPIEVSLSTNPPSNKKVTAKVIGAVGETDPRNRITQGRQAPYSEPKYAIAVDIRQLDILYSYATPVLTPFDFLIVKCNILIGEFATFLSRYIPTFFAEMVGISSAEERATSFQLFSKANFGEPFDDEAVRWCFGALLWAADELDKHSPKGGDTNTHKGFPTLNMGFHRRFQILSGISGGPGSKSSFRTIASQLSRIARGDHRKYLLKPIDNSLDYLTPEYLRDLALEIHEDVQRAAKASLSETTRLEYNYQGPRRPPPRQ